MRLLLFEVSVSIWEFCFVLKDLFYVPGCFTLMYAVHHVPSALGGQNRVSDPLELELQAAVSHHVGFRT